MVILGYSSRYTKFLFLKPMKKLSTDVVVKYMSLDLFHTFRVPETIFSDNGTQFKAFRHLGR